MQRSLSKVFGIGLVLAGFSAAPAFAGTIPYANTGSVNPVTYSFTASATGEVTAYFYAGPAGYTESLGLFDSTTNQNIGGLGLTNQTSSHGQSLDFGTVTAGDSLVFFIHIDNGAPETGAQIYSNASLNSDVVNHVYSTTFAGDATIPTGTYVGFEDLLAPNNPDYNYTDEQFVFTNTGGTASDGSVIGSTDVPEPMTLAVLSMGIAGLGFARKRRA